MKNERGHYEIKKWDVIICPHLLCERAIASVYDHNIADVVVIINVVATEVIPVRDIGSIDVKIKRPCGTNLLNKVEKK